jgi:acetolactate synthase-1/2/3 large subunit
MTVAEYVINRISQEVTDVFGVVGGGSMYLFDALARHSQLRYIACHHEQAAAMAAEGYSRIAGFGVCLVSTGPAATNTLTGVACAFMDSIPMLVITGQANSHTLIKRKEERQNGVHEVDIESIARPITKLAYRIRSVEEVKSYLDYAITLAKGGRPGPVLIDIPLDIQNSEYVAKDMFFASYKDKEASYEEIENCLTLLIEAQRPVIVLGHGVRMANISHVLLDFAERFQIPIVTTKMGFDMVPYTHPCHIGMIGNYGTIAGNKAVQQADLLLMLGTRLTAATTGYNREAFAPDAVKVLVDIDEVALKQSCNNISIDLPIQSSVFSFVIDLLANIEGIEAFPTWLKKCRDEREAHPTVKKEWYDQKYINPYCFYEMLAEVVGDDAIVISDQGASFYAMTTAFRVKAGQRVFTNGGFSPMGYGLPAAIGAAIAAPHRPVYCIHGDGGLQLNIQELSTLAHYFPNLKLFVFENDGYVSLKNTQDQYFEGRYIGSDNRDLLLAGLTSSAGFFGVLSAKIIADHEDLRGRLKAILSCEGPFIIPLNCNPHQPFTPRVASYKDEQGVLQSPSLENMKEFE